MASSTLLSDNGVSSGSAGIKTSGGNDGVLLLQTTTAGGAATTAVTVDNAQNVGVGVTPSAWGTVKPALQVGPTAFFVSYGTSAVASTYTGNNAYFDGSNWKYIANGSAVMYEMNSGNGSYKWNTAASGTAGNAISFTQAMTLDASGNLLLGATSYALSNSNSILFNTSGGTEILQHANGTSSGTFYAGYVYNNSIIGSITQNGTTGVLYNLTSDYRLKNNPEVLTGAKDFVMALQPKKWQWWDGSGEGIGFIAHEFMEVAKYSGQGEKDAVETIEIKDEEGNVTGTEERPIYQSIQPSSSEVMANLVSLIQEQQTQIEDQLAIITAQQTALTTLTARIEALEGAKA